MEPDLAGLAAFVAIARHIPIVVLARTGEVLAATDAARNALGDRSGTLVGAAWEDVCADPAERTREYVEQCARTLAPIPGAFRIRNGGGETRFRCEGYAVLFGDAPERALVLQIRPQQKHDTFVLLSQKLQDLNTEVLRRRESERQLSDAQRRLRAILDQMPAGVTIAEAPSGRTVYSNRLATEMFGGVIAADAASAYGERFTCRHFDGRPYRSEEYPLARALAGEVLTGQELQLLRADGTLTVVRSNAAPIRDEIGTIVAAVTASYDVSEEKQLSQAMLSARAEAEMANHAKDEFLAMLGHELRNPLAPILTALHLMRQRGEGAERERAIIERQTKHLVRLVDDLLDVSRITTGKVELQRERIELGAVVARALEMAGPLLEQRRIELVLSVPNQGLLLDVDPARLAQVISNLLTNAAKYSEPGATTWVSGRAEGKEIVLEVRDSGIGIAPDILPRIFELFVQEKQTLERSQGGLGLGLAIVHSLVSLHGGTVAVDSPGKGRGSRFSVRLPAVAQNVTGSMSAPRSVDGSAETPVGLRVLVVDDNEDAAELLAEVLSILGLETRVAYDGAQALSLAESFSPELALLDIGLPILDGYELAKRLRQNPRFAAMRLVAITGYGQPSDKARTAAAGFDAHLVKPVDVAALESLVRQWLPAV